MDENEILQRQVDALEKLLQIKEAIIQEQESKISKLEQQALIERFPQMPYAPPYQPLPTMPSQPAFIPSVFTHDPCVDGGLHDYVQPWYSTTPQPCNRCGKTLPQGFTITSTNVAKLGDV